MRRFAIAGLACALAACATSEEAPTDPMGRAVTAPLIDLNLLRAKIPPPLISALDAPYALPARLSGAERHSRLVASAAAAGVVRRSFLKGLGAAAGCAPPAAPQVRG